MTAYTVPDRQKIWKQFLELAQHFSSSPVSLCDLDIMTYLTEGFFISTGTAVRTEESICESLEQSDTSVVDKNYAFKCIDCSCHSASSKSERFAIKCLHVHCERWKTMRDWYGGGKDGNHIFLPKE